MRVAAFFVAFCSMFVAHSASAQSSVQLRSFDGETLSNTIKCEVGSFAQYLPKSGIPASKLKVKISITAKNTNNVSGSVLASFLKIFESSAGFEATTEQSMQLNDIPYNIHRDNAVKNCRKNNIIPGGIGILSCLRRQLPTYLDAVEGGGAISCSNSMTVKASASGKASGVPVWTITIGPSFGLSRTAVFTVTTSAPPAPK